MAWRGTHGGQGMGDAVGVTGALGTEGTGTLSGEDSEDNVDCMLGGVAGEAEAGQPGEGPQDEARVTDRSGVFSIVVLGTMPDSLSARPRELPVADSESSTLIVVFGTIPNPLSARPGELSVTDLELSRAPPLSSEADLESVSRQACEQRSYWIDSMSL